MSTLRTPRLAILADDLTGALDAGAPFAARGLKTIVVCDPGEIRAALDEGAEIVAVTTRSREIEPGAAQARVAAALRALPAGTPLFKKVDSRLKGRIEAELSALPADRLLVLPAIPEFGRHVRDGKVVGFGVDRPIAVAAALGRHARRARIPETGSIEAMRRALASAGADDLLVGARGLADALADQLSRSATPTTPVVACRAVTMVIGSRDPITLAQVERLRRDHPELCRLAAPNGRAATEDPSPTPAATLLQATDGPEVASEAEVADNLAASLRRCGLAGRDLLVLSGGATAQAILDRLAIARMEILGEILPGLPVARAGGLTIVTKSGGFGAPDALARVLQAVAPRLGRGAP